MVVMKFVTVSSFGLIEGSWIINGLNIPKKALNSRRDPVMVMVALLITGAGISNDLYSDARMICNPRRTKPRLFVCIHSRNFNLYHTVIKKIRNDMPKLFLFMLKP